MKPHHRAKSPFPWVNIGLVESRNASGGKE